MNVAADWAFFIGGGPHPQVHRFVVTRYFVFAFRGSNRRLLVFPDSPCWRFFGRLIAQHIFERRSELRFE
jgi:hypothetical protein